MNVTLLATLIITQVALWVGYKHQMAGKTMSMFWGNVPRSMWTYLLGAATVAYAMNLFFLGKLALGNPRFPNTLAMATVAYYGMQMLFLPMVEQAVKNGGSRWPVRILLFLCIFPIAAMAAYGTVEVGFGSVLTAVFPLLHVAINDFVLYGFLF